MTDQEKKTAVEELIAEYGENRSLVNILNNLIHRMKYLVLIFLSSFSMILMTSVTASAQTFTSRFYGGWRVRCNSDTIQWKSAFAESRTNGTITWYRNCTDLSAHAEHYLGGEQTELLYLLYDDKFWYDGREYQNTLKPRATASAYYDTEMQLMFYNCSARDVQVRQIVLLQDGRKFASKTYSTPVTVEAGMPRQLVNQWAMSHLHSYQYIVYYDGGEMLTGDVDGFTESDKVFHRYDINDDGKVDVSDVTAIIQYINNNNN